MKPDWFTEDGTFIGPWWLRWAWLAVALGAPVAWLFTVGSISDKGMVLWCLFLAGLNLFRAREFYQPIVRWIGGRR